ncbi:OTU domain-containing protein 5 isoform X1 [Catharus ustulatus]|uniref:OTU domain-containing protein 5 isoform X1 n=1 Tax=Catharus ustulatus TaxID=91951 RepID=UPI00140DDB85|nr:OTU domain-containing protein 5 isoform X1 [Catharus ustulatus]
MGLGPGCGSPGPDEAGGGYNSEDEYEAGRVEMDPATAEQEHRFEKALREKKGFIIKRMKEDGACLFRAVADQVYGDQDMHEVVRKHCMDYLMKNADYFSNYVTEDFTTYINRKRKSTCHGNHIEMQAMAEMYNRPVEVYQYGTEPINTFHGIQHNEDEPIRVSYHRNIHYNSVVNPNKATIGVGLGLPSFKPGLAEQSLMKSAIKTSEESWIEQQMLEDKKRATDWEATNEAIEEQVARESYLQWLRDQEKQARQPRKASATCSSATAAAASGLEEWSGRSPRPRSAAPSPEHPGLHPETPGPKPPSPGAPPAGKPPSPCAPGTSSQLGAGGGPGHAPAGVAVPRARVPRHHAADVPDRLRPERLGGRRDPGVGAGGVAAGVPGDHENLAPQRPRRRQKLILNPRTATPPPPQNPPQKSPQTLRNHPLKKTNKQTKKKQQTNKQRNITADPPPTHPTPPPPPKKKNQAGTCGCMAAPAGGVDFGGDKNPPLVKGGGGHSAGRRG